MSYNNFILYEQNVNVKVKIIIQGIKNTMKMFFLWYNIRQLTIIQYANDKSNFNTTYYNTIYSVVSFEV